MKPFVLTRARSLDEVLRTRSTSVADAMLLAPDTPGGATVLKASGVDLLDLIKQGLLAPDRVVSLAGVPSLDAIREDAGGLRIGALATLEQIAAHPVVRARFQALADAAARSASPQIRHVATLGGNLLQRPRCWYFRSAQHRCVRKGGDTCFAFGGENDYHAIFEHAGCAMVHASTPATALVALDARVELGSPSGARRTVALEDFLLAPQRALTRECDLRPGEVLTAVLLAAPAPSTQSVHLRQGQLDSFDWPLADVAAVLTHDADGTCRKASVVLGAAAPVPHRAVEAERALTGRHIDATVAAEAARAALAGAQPLSGNAYKVPIFEALVRRAVLAAGWIPLA